MTPADLQDTINHAIAILKENKSTVTPELLGIADKVLDSLKAIQSADTNYQTFVKDMANVIDIEKRLVETKMTDNLVEILTKIQYHPIIMRMIARIL